jgi:hypothetical protein
MTFFALVARLTSAAMSLGTIYYVGKIGEELAGRRGGMCRRCMCAECNSHILWAYHEPGWSVFILVQSGNFVLGPRNRAPRSWPDSLYDTLQCRCHRHEGSSLCDLLAKPAAKPHSLVCYRCLAKKEYATGLCCASCMVFDRTVAIAAHRWSRHKSDGVSRKVGFSHR